MKKVILGAALCSAAVALAGAANAEDRSYDFLYGSTDALVLGPTGVQTPDAAYINAVQNLYLDPNGYGGTTASTLALTIPGNWWDFGGNVTQGQDILINAIVADYNAGEMGCDASGVWSDPLTIVTYSQSSLIASLAQQQLADENIPSDALRFVMLGANPGGVPDGLYPTAVYNIDGDFWSNPFDPQFWINLFSPGGFEGTSFQEILYSLLVHETYLGLTPDQIASAVPTVDGMTTYFDIPTLSWDELWSALFNSFTI
jgi:hypothetical protein